MEWEVWGLVPGVGAEILVDRKGKTIPAIINCSKIKLDQQQNIR